MTELVASAVAGYLGTVILSMIGLVRWNVEGAIALGVAAYVGRAIQAGAWLLPGDAAFLAVGWYVGAVSGLALAEVVWHRS